MYSNRRAKSSLIGCHEDEWIDRTNNKTNENESQTKPNESKRIDHELSNNIDNNNNTFYLAIFRFAGQRINLA